METINYSDRYINTTREELLGKISQAMSKKRFEHILRVEQTALMLAKKHDADLEKTSIAALLHDFAKESPDQSMQDIVISENLDLELLTYGNPIWHGPTGAILANKMFDVEDQEILDAIAYHTSGAKPEDSLVQKIIFVADYIEPERDFSGVDTARQIAEESIDEAVFYELTHTLKYLLKKEVLIYPRTLANYNAWIQYYNKN